MKKYNSKRLVLKFFIVICLLAGTAFAYSSSSVNSCPYDPECRANNQCPQGYFCDWWTCECVCECPDPFGGCPGECV